jgi:hypothetical protein
VREKINSLIPMLHEYIMFFQRLKASSNSRLIKYRLPALSGYFHSLGCISI